MRNADGRLAFSATDLSRHLSCGHLTSLRRAVALGEIDPPPPYDDPRADVLRQRGIEHEQRLLEQLAADGRTVETITATDTSFSHRDRAEAAAQTREAMRRRGRCDLPETPGGRRRPLERLPPTSCSG